MAVLAVSADRFSEAVNATEVVEDPELGLALSHSGNPVKRHATLFALTVTFSTPPFDSKESWFLLILRECPDKEA
jgi:hypothetical protein